MEYTLRSTGSEEEFLRKSVDGLAKHITDSIEKYGHAIIGLSGGSTPKPIYTELGKKDIEWDKVSVFLVDERYIGADDTDSNQLMVRSTLLEHAHIPDDQIIFPDTALPLDECITDYEVRIATLLAKGIPHSITLGMGDDAHIASLFPPLPDVAFGDHLVIHTETDSFAVHDRISVTMVVLLSAQTKIFYLKGDAKKFVWNEVIESEFDPYRFPAQAVLRIGGAEVITCW